MVVLAYVNDHDLNQLLAVQLDEMLIIEKMEKMVDPDQPEGEWITKYDLVEKVRHSVLDYACVCQNGQ